MATHENTNTAVNALPASPEPASSPGDDRAAPAAHQLVASALPASWPSVVSVVMPVRDGAATLNEQLEAMHRQEYPGEVEILVVVNGSGDSTGRLLRDWAARLPLTILTCSGVVGANTARNLGCRAARGEVLLFCDADDVVAPGWMTAMVAGLRRHDAVCATLDRDNLNSPLALAARPGRGTPGLIHTFGFLPYAAGAALGLRRTAYERIGGFDTAYDYGGGDDIDLCWRLQLAGGSIAHVPDAIVHYRLRTSVRAVARQLFDYGRSHARLYAHYRTFGMPGPDASGFDPANQVWARLARELPAALRDPHRRIRWCADAAFRLGRLAGSAQHRVWYT